MIVWISLAGGLGAAARLFVDGIIRERRSSTYLGTNWHAIAGIGFLGGYTTFSTASFETARLALDSRYRAALANGIGMLVTAVAAASLGFWIGTRW